MYITNCILYICVCGILDIPYQISADSGLLKGGARFQVGHRKEDVQHQDDAALPRAGALGKKNGPGDEPLNLGRLDELEYAICIWLKMTYPLVI